MPEQVVEIKNITQALQNALESKTRGDYDRAIYIYQQLINLQDNNPIFYDELAQVQAQQGNSIAAIKNYQKAIELGIKNPYWTYKNLGDALKKEHHLAEAITVYQKAIQVDDKNPVTYDALGQVRALNGDFNAAIENYQKAIDLGIKNPVWTYKNLEKALEDRQKHEAPEMVREKSLNLPKDKNKPESLSKKNHKQTVAKTPKNRFKVHHLAEEYFGQEKWQDAIEFYQQAIELNPNYFWSYYNLGRAYSKLQQAERAISYYRQAIKVKPQKPEFVCLALGAIFKEQKPDSAVAILSQASEIFPEATTALFTSELRELNAITAELESEQHQIVEHSEPPTEDERLFPDLDDEQFIKHIYQIFLKRAVDPEGLNGNLEALADRVPRRIIVENILKTEEFAAKNNQYILEDMSDRQFLRTFWRILLGRGCDRDAEKAYLHHLENGLTRMQLIAEITKSGEFRDRIENIELLDERESRYVGSVWIMGTDKYLTQDEWEQTLLKAFRDRLCQFNRNSLSTSLNKQKQPISRAVKKYLSLNTSPLVSIITSLYKGREFIEHFLENITTQTIFDACELIIIDANSPEGEFEIIKQYMHKFSNIKYIRTERLIGIYEAWNIGVETAKGKFLTNANLDDLRRIDCLEKQAAALLQNKTVDLVYQDFYYSLTANLTFDIIEKCGYRSQLPQVSRDNMIQFNSPHNAPMWRKSLHKRVGLFNTAYRSAGDYELWMRALLKDTKFLKIEEALVVYYNNPSGISTRVEGHGSLETKEIQAIYQTLFSENLFSLSASEFVDLCRDRLGLTGNINLIQSPEKTWQKNLMLLDRCFEREIKVLAKDKFYFPLKDTV